MNKTTYSTYMFTYKNKHDFNVEIFARREETANKMIAVWNENLEESKRWKPKKIGFKKPAQITTPPYEAEQKQQTWFEHIRDEFVNNGGKKTFGSIVYDENTKLTSKNGKRHS